MNMPLWRQRYRTRTARACRPSYAVRCADHVDERCHYADDQATVAKARSGGAWGWRATRRRRARHASRARRRACEPGSYFGHSSGRLPVRLVLVSGMTRKPSRYDVEQGKILVNFITTWAARREGKR